MKKKVLLVALGFILIWGLGWTIYSNSLHGQFQFDDMGYVARNDSIRDITNIKAIWNALEHPSRFVGFLTFAANFHFAQGDVFLYHVTNVIIHLMVVTSLWWFVWLIFGTPAVRQRRGISQSLYDNRVGIAFFVALIFLVHPMATQAVSYIAQRLASLATLFYLMTMNCYLKGRMSSILLRRCIWFLGMVIFSILGMFTKQITFTMPFMILILELYFLHNKGNSVVKIKNIFKPLYLIPFMGFVFIIPWIMKFNVMSIFSWNVKSGSHFGDMITAPKYFFTQMRVVSHYIRLLFIPIGQNLDYDWTISHSFFEIKVLAGFIFLVTLFILGLRMVRRYRLISFGIIWFFVTASIESSIIPIRHVIFEHRVYLPMVGFSIAFVTFLFYWIKNRKCFIIVLSALVMIFSFLTYQRNKVWSNHFTMWSDVIKKSPGKARPYNNLAIGYLEEQRNDDAFVLLNKSLERDPGFAEALNNRGVVFKRRGQYSRAIEDFDKAIEMKGDYIDAYYNRGNAYHYGGRYKEALRDFGRVLDININFVEAYNELGIVYKKMRQYDKSIEMYNIAMRIAPGYADAIYNRGNVYYLKRNLKQAYEDFSRAISYKKNFFEAHMQRGVVLRHLGKFEEALKDLNRSLVIGPNNVMAYYSRGKVYMSLNQLDKAAVDFTHAIKINPGLKESYNERGILFKKQKKFDMALKDFNKALAIDPTYVDAYNNRANVYTGLEDYESAIKDYDNAIRVNPGFATSYYNKGLIMDYRKEWEESIALYSKAIELNPSLNLAFWKRSNVYRSLGRPKEAMDDVLKAEAMGLEIHHVYFKQLENEIFRFEEEQKKKEKK